MHMEHFWDDNDGEKTEVLGEKPVQASLLPQFPHWMAWHQTQASKYDRPAINKIREQEKGAHRMSETAHMRKSPVQNLPHHMHLNVRWPPTTVFILSGSAYYTEHVYLCAGLQGNHAFSSWWSRKKFLSCIGVNNDTESIKMCYLNHTNNKRKKSTLIYSTCGEQYLTHSSIP